MSAAAAAPAASPSDLYARLGVSEAILVEEMERRQADVGDFLLVEEGDSKRRCILPWQIGYRSGRGRRQRRRRYICGRSAGRRRPGHPGDSEHGYSFIGPPALCGSLHLRHSGIPPLPSLEQTHDEPLTFVHNFVRFELQHETSHLKRLSAMSTQPSRRACLRGSNRNPGDFTQYSGSPEVPALYSDSQAASRRAS